ncbi:UDP binding domain-containing protein [Streptomyces sp. SID8374]|uniref:UDP binding domain-containing protein n=1 Tax=Streptomyces sp. SID8374 TaxID=2690354 RepID=UPI0031B9C642
MSPRTLRRPWRPGGIRTGGGHGSPPLPPQPGAVPGSSCEGRGRGSSGRDAEFCAGALEELAGRWFASPSGRRITVWGAAFKPNTDDIRDSPALAVARKLHELGATVTVTDPKALDNARKVHPELDYVEDPIAAVEGADLLLHLTEWPEFSRVDPGQLARRVADATVVDGRGTLDVDVWRTAGWTVRALGRA